MIIKGQITLFGKKKTYVKPILDTKIKYLIEHHVDIDEPNLDLNINLNRVQKTSEPIKRKIIKINYE